MNRGEIERRIDALEAANADHEKRIDSLEGWRQWAHGLAVGAVVFLVAISRKFLKVIGLDVG